MATLSDEERKARNREYNRIWREKNREKYRQQQADYRERHREDIRARHREWVEENKEVNETHKRKHYLVNKDRYDAGAKQYWKDRPEEKAAHCAKRRAKKLQRTPLWANQARIKKFYMFAGWLSRLIGKPIEVDHIIPLQGKLVSGLHVENNLQLLLASENYSKGNKFNVC